MNLIDLLLVVVVGLGAWAGSRRGLVRASGDLVSLAASLAFAFWFYPRGVAWAALYRLEMGVWMTPLVFLMAYLLARTILGALLGTLARRVPTAAHAHGVNRVLGALPGAGTGVINATIVSMLVLALPLNDETTRSASESELANRLAVPAEWLQARLRPIFDPAIDRTLTRLTVGPGSPDAVALDFTVPNPKHRPDLEGQMLVLVNEERRANGLRPLQADADLGKVARAHSVDMFSRGYFSHLTPEGQDPFGRMRAAGVRFLAAGENLALARTLAMAHQGLMDSPGHRANILRRGFGRVGIGIVDGGRHG